MFSLTHAHVSLFIAANDVPTSNIAWGECCFGDDAAILLDWKHFDLQPRHVIIIYFGLLTLAQLYILYSAIQNILTFTPPGFKQSLNVKFPDSRLAVCEKCKKNFKTRDMCRVRNTHTTAPWTTAYICLTLDESCTGEDGRYVDKPLTVRMVQWQPFCVKKPFDPKTPVCAACKKTNRTRSFCRERHKHRQLPWCTVYVLLSALDTADPSTVVAGPSKPLHGDKKDDEEKTQDSKDDDKTASSPANVGGQSDVTSPAESKTSESVEGMSENVKPEDPQQKSGSGDDGDNINDISESRTFLAKVCCKSTTIHWLDLAEYEGNDAAGMHQMVPAENPGYAMNPAQHPMPVQGVDPNQAQYYAHAAMGAYQHHHQNALKNHQQYYFQMQQRHQHYAAQQAAWQAQYGQQPPPMQMPPQAPQPAQAPPPQDGPAPAPVTAGEAAAQQQKRSRQMAEESGQQPPPPPVPPPPHQPPQPGQQQQQWMLYQQMYQAQLPPMTPQGHPYPPPPGRPHGQPQDGSNVGMQSGVMAPNNDQQYQDSMPAEGNNGKANHENDAKRQRLV